MALDDDLVAGVGETVKGAVGQDGVIEESEPLVDSPVGSDDEAGPAMPGDDQLVEVDGLLLGHPVEAEVVEDEQVRGEEGAEGLVRGVVHPGLSHGPEEVVGAFEADGVSGPDGGIAESLGDEALAHAHRSDEQDVLVAVQELEGEGGVEEPAIERDGCGPVEVFETADLIEAGPLEAELQAACGLCG